MEQMRRFGESPDQIDKLERETNDLDNHRLRPTAMILGYPPCTGMTSKRATRSLSPAS